jgi:hypothetical protein
MNVPPEMGAGTAPHRLRQLLLSIGSRYPAGEEVPVPELLLEWGQLGLTEEQLGAAAVRAYSRRMVQLIITQRRPELGPAVKTPSGYLRGIIFYSDLGGA